MNLIRVFLASILLFNPALSLANSCQYDIELENEAILLHEEGYYEDFRMAADDLLFNFQMCPSSETRGRLLKLAYRYPNELWDFIYTVKYVSSTTLGNLYQIGSDY